jgi:hypothetical protein
MIYDYGFFKSLFDEGWDGFKGFYFRETQKRFEKEFGKVGMWGWCQEKDRMGILNESKGWHDYNRINTHPNICKFFYEECVKESPNSFIEFGNPQYHKENVTILWDFIVDNFELYFTKNITDRHFNLINGLLNQSWQRGSISIIISVIYIKKIFSDVKDIKFGFQTGDKNDMNGIDIEVTLSDDSIIKIQVKSGRYTDKNYGGRYYVNGSSNDLDYNKCDYYIYCQTKYGKQPSSFIMFKNTPEIGRKNDSIVVPVDNIKFKIQEDMIMPENLTELMKLCTENNYHFEIKKEEDFNYIKLDEENKQLVVNFSDYDDTSLEKQSIEMLEQLKKMFN